MRAIVLTLAIGLSAAWCIASLWLPFGWDHGVFATVGDEILSGGMPYRDAWDVKGPGAFLWFALAQKLFGRVQFGVRVLDVIVLVAAAASLARVTRHICRPRLAPWTAVALVLWWGSLTFFFTAQPDGVASLLLTCAFAPLIIGPARVPELIAAGLVVGLATLVKPHFVLFGIVPVIAALRSGLATRSMVMRIAATGAAVLVPVALVAAWIAANGAWRSMIDVLFSYNVSEHSGLTSIASRERLIGFGKFAAYFVSGPMLLALPLIAVGLRNGFRTRDRATRLVALWLAVALALIVVQNKYFVYHWTITIPPTILLIVLGIDRLLNSNGLVVTARRATIAAVLLGAGVLVQLSARPVTDVSQWLRYVTGGQSHAAFYSRFKREGFVAADQMAAADHIRAHSSATDRIVLLGYDAPALYLSGRHNATRFTHALPLDSWRASPATLQRHRAEFMRAFDTPPLYVIVGLLFAGKEKTFKSFPQFRDVLMSRYSLERSFGGVDVYRRKEY
jgi:4-amino-4-deoxy-L-arabinose transferase-like glycosyltransferase